MAMPTTTAVPISSTQFTCVVFDMIEAILYRNGSEVNP